MRFTEKPLAVCPYKSYRYRGAFGWVMIAAMDNEDALKEAQRSVESTVTMDRLEYWDGQQYQPIK